MERMEHFHSARLTEGDKTILDNLDGYLGFHIRSQGRKQWYGFFELSNDQQIVMGVRYRLTLQDGRSVDIHAADVPDSDPKHLGKHMVEFYVSGELRERRRGMESSGRLP
jgi:hypothetical protein